MKYSVSLFITIILLCVAGSYSLAAAPDKSGSCGLFSADSTELLIDADVARIPDYAFADCRKLRRVRFAAGSKCSEIGRFAFLGCSALEDIELPASLQSLQEGAFRECSAMRYIQLPHAITVIPPQCFSWCTALEKVDMLSAPEDIRQFAFIYCFALRDFDFGDRLRHIGNNAFSRCESLGEALLPPGVEEIESYAFSDCLSLRKAVMPANKNLLGELIFSNTPSLRVLVAPSAVPPSFDCRSFPFDPDDGDAWARCVLYVPDGARDAYLAAEGWSLFNSIK